MVNRAKQKIQHLLSLNNTPREIAFGVSLGVFIGITFPYGLHTLIAILLSVFIPRTNKIAIIGGTYVSIPPTVPFIVWAGYEVGCFILQKNYPVLSWPYFKSITYQKVLELYYPVFVGSLVLGIFSAFCAYFIAFNIARSLKKQ